jgi:UDP-N-acetylmuramate dehydrogenase
MKVTERPSLKAFNTFRVDARAGLLLTIETEEELLSLSPFCAKRDLVLGEGSNTLFAGDVPGTVFLNRIAGKEILEVKDKQVLVEVGAGENWHQLVLWSLKHNLYGLENLSLIPGSTGAAPIQNIGAYGVELSSVLESVTAWDWQMSAWVTLRQDECELGYRDSRFKSRERDRYLITSVRLQLDQEFRPRLDYSGLRQELAMEGSSRPTGRAVSDAVIRLRRARLPDPAVAGNAGSFFKNPVVSRADGSALLADNPDLPYWLTGDSMLKISAAWMIEQCGLKGFRNGDAGISDQHALVLVNYASATGAEIQKLAEHVQSVVYAQFGIRLEPEPRIIDFSA